MTRRTSEPPAPRRLFDEPERAAGSVEAWAVDLLRAGEPGPAPPARKQRVRLRIGHAPRPSTSLALRAGVALVVLVGGAAGARAALGRWPAWVVRVYEQLAPARAARPIALARAAAVAPAQTPPPVAPSAAVAAPIARGAPPWVAPAPAKRSVAAPAPVKRPVAPAAATEDSAIVLEAMRALRRAHDPVRARALLGGYLDRYPGGALAEEALALSIEAAVLHHDPDAAGLAARYLRLYPAGSFRPLARQTLSAAAQEP